MAQRRFGTVLRDNAVHEMHEQVLKSLGVMACYVSKGYIQMHQRKDRTEHTYYIVHTEPHAQAQC